MKVNELIEHLKKLPQDLEVYGFDRGVGYPLGKPSVSFLRHDNGWDEWVVSECDDFYEEAKKLAKEQSKELTPRVLI